MSAIEERDSAWRELLLWPQDGRRKLRQRATRSKDKPFTEEDTWRHYYLEGVYRRGVLGQVLIVSVIPLVMAWLITRSPYLGAAALVAFFGGLAVSAKAFFDEGKPDYPNFTTPPITPVKQRDMSDWREGILPVVVLGLWGTVAYTLFLLDALLWFVMPVVPKEWREMSQSYGRTDSLPDEQMRAIFTAMMVLATAYSLYEGLGKASIFFAAVATGLTLWQRYEIYCDRKNSLDPNKNPTYS